MPKTFAPVAVLVAAALCLPNVALASSPRAAPGMELGGALVLQPAADPTAGMTDEQKLARAKELYGEADAKFQAGNFTEALTMFEEAYNVYAPSFHVFNFNIGVSAYELGDCAKAKTAFGRFLDLVPEHPSRGDAQEKLIEIERSGCANTAAPTTTTPPTTTTTTAPVTEDEDDAPLLTSKRDEREEASERERDQRDAKKQHPLVIAGAVLTAVGGAALIGSGISLALANSKATRLASLASPSDETGFPSGNYSDDEVFNLDSSGLPNNNVATIALLVGGGVVAATGIALLVVGIKRKKAERGGKASDKKASLPKQRRSLTVAPAYLPRGGGAAATVRF